MCLQITNQQFNKMEVTDSTSNKKMSYSIKKMLKQFFKLHKSQKLIISHETISIEESSKYFDSNHNEISVDMKYPCMESSSFDSSSTNEIYEPVAATNQSCEMEDYDFGDLSANIPVHFVRTEHGTFFWTSSSEIPADNDLVQPMSCSTNNQLACLENHWTHV